MELLKFSNPNDKLKAFAKRERKPVKTFSIPSGWTCPGALGCMAHADKQTRKLTDGKDMRFRCMSASDESQYKDTFNQRWHNFRLLTAARTSDAMATLIGQSLPNRVDIVRIHIGGDFYNAEYFRAWCEVARTHPDVLFYAYTKSILIWRANRELVPSNLVLTASRDGRSDSLIGDLKSTHVVFSIDEARALGLEIDHDDTHAMRADGKSFALLIHHTQPAGSAASRAMQALRKQGGIGSYSRSVKLNENRAALADALAA